MFRIGHNSSHSTDFIACGCFHQSRFDIHLFAKSVPNYFTQRLNDICVYRVILEFYFNLIVSSYVSNFAPLHQRCYIGLGGPDGAELFAMIDVPRTGAVRRGRPRRCSARPITPAANRPAPAPLVINDIKGCGDPERWTRQPTPLDRQQQAVGGSLSRHTRRCGAPARPCERRRCAVFQAAGAGQGEHRHPLGRGSRTGSSIERESLTLILIPRDHHPFGKPTPG